MKVKYLNQRSRLKGILKSIAIQIIRTLLPNIWQRMEEQKSRLNDWGQLQVYHQKNINLYASIIVESRIVFFGDSITEFWDLEATFKNKNYINRGISGQTTSQMLVRFRNDVIALHPKFVVILAGINDLAGNTGAMTIEMIEGNYLSMCELAQINHIRIICASVLPINENSPLSQSDPQVHVKIRTLNSWLQGYCDKQQQIYLDYYSHMVDSQGMLKEELSDDGLHPNAKGYAVMAKLIEEVIQQFK